MSSDKKLEPRFSLPDSTPRSSKTTFVISGLQIYVYGLEELSAVQGKGSEGSGTGEGREGSLEEIAVLYLAHQRTRTYAVTEGIAHEVLHRYREDERPKKVKMIAVTFNMRNHGDREVSKDANKTWADGNETHGIDLISSIDGSALDFKLIMDFLPAYLPQFSRFRNIMAGISLGGHTAWRLPSFVPTLEAIIIVVGCPNLTSLMLSRLDVSSTGVSPDGTPDGLRQVPYEDLEKVMTEVQKRRWPRALHDVVRESDRKVAEAWKELPLLLMGGELDPLVPMGPTELWFDKHKNGDIFIQSNTGHSCTKEMVHMMARWLGSLYEA